MVYLSFSCGVRRRAAGTWEKQVFNRDTRVAWRARYGRVRAQKEAPRASLSHKAMAEPPVAGPWTQAGEPPLRSSRVRHARGARGYVGERPRVVQELWQTLDDEQGEIFAKEDDIVGTAEDSRSLHIAIDIQMDALGQGMAALEGCNNYDTVTSAAAAAQFPSIWDAAEDVRQTASTETVRTFLLCHARARAGLDRAPAPVLRRIAESAGDCFFAADRDRPFSGSRPGYVFKLGTRGLGYYPDYRAPENWAAWERSFSVRDRTRRAWKQRVRDARAQLAHVRGQLEDDYVRILCDARTAADRRAFEEQRGAWLESRDDLAEDVPDHLFEE